MLKLTFYNCIKIGNTMKKLTKAVALSAILGGAILATTPAQAWFGGPGGWGGGPWNSGGPWGNNNYMDDWMDGTGWGDMNFSTSAGGRGYGRNNYRGHGYGYPYGGGYGGYPYGGGYAPYGPGGYAPVQPQQPSNDKK